MNKQHNKAVLFDLDGTLIDTAPDMIYALKTVLENNHTNTSISDKGDIGSGSGKFKRSCFIVAKSSPKA